MSTLKRRVRNRESAAASRNKQRAKIEELQGEVDELKSNYAKALQRIVELEAEAAAYRSHASFTPAPLRHALHQEQDGEESPSPVAVSPPLSPRDSFTLDGNVSDESDTSSDHGPTGHRYTHIMMSRPNA